MKQLWLFDVKDNVLLINFSFSISNIELLSFKLIDILLNDISTFNSFSFSYLINFIFEKNFSINNIESGLIINSEFEFFLIKKGITEPFSRFNVSSF